MINHDETRSIVCYDLSLAMALCTQAIPNHCYANAWQTLEALAAWPELCLVEGWMVLEQPTEITVIEHGWCEHNGLLIDPSIVLLLPKSACLAVHYFPGVRRQRAELHTLATRDLPYVCSCGQYGPDGFGHPDYQAAYRGAYRLAAQFAGASSPPRPLVVQASVTPSPNEGRRALVVQIVSSHNFRTNGARKQEGQEHA